MASQIINDCPFCADNVKFSCIYQHSANLVKENPKGFPKGERKLHIRVDVTAAICNNYLY